VAVLDAAENLIAFASAPLTESLRDGETVSQDPGHWWRALCIALRSLGQSVNLAEIGALAVAGTSGSVLLTDAQGRPLTPALMYNDLRPTEIAQAIAQHAPPESAACGRGSALARLLWWQRALPASTRHILHQADWLAGRLCGRFGISDENNALKLGYDPLACCWPAWLDALDVKRDLLPGALPPGTVIGSATVQAHEQTGLPVGARVHIGTTDSIAATLAAGARALGDGVTALGTTLAIKLISDRPVFNAKFGIYSHRIGGRWLAGGASNSGGAALARYFSLAEIEHLSPVLRPDETTGLDYHPLPATGERFPIADPDMISRVEPVPADRVRFLQGLLEGIARIEARGYALLHELGAPKLTSIRSIGGGAKNAAWTAIRERALGLPMAPARYLHAAAGAAILAVTGTDVFRTGTPVRPS
jgi:sugar (pentulose or hexulose) kinase